MAEAMVVVVAGVAARNGEIMLCRRKADALEGSKKAVVVCSPGSYAEAYAKENNIPYRTR